MENSDGSFVVSLKGWAEVDLQLGLVFDLHAWLQQLGEGLLVLFCGIAWPGGSNSCCIHKDMASYRPAWITPIVIVPSLDNKMWTSQSIDGTTREDPTWIWVITGHHVDLWGWTNTHGPYFPAELTNLELSCLISNPLLVMRLSWRVWAKSKLWKLAASRKYVTKVTRTSRMFNLNVQHRSWGMRKVNNT